MLKRDKSGPALGQSTHHPAFSVYMYSVIGLGLAAVILALYELPQQGTGYLWVVLAALSLFSSSFSVKIPTINSKISIGDTLCFTNILLFGTSAGTITAAAEAFAGSFRARNRSRRGLYALFNVGAMAGTAYVSGALFYAIMERSPLSQPPETTVAQMIVPLAVLGFTHYILNSGCVATIVALENRKNIFAVWKNGFLWTSITYFAGAFAAGIIAITIGTITPQVLGVAVPVLMAVYFTYKTYLDKVEEVRVMAYYDGLTKLPNRVLFREHLDQALLSSQRQGLKFAVMFLDLDNFKRINDTFGHNIGDQLIRNVAERLASCLRVKGREGEPETQDPSVVISRFAGDEFNILLTRIGSPKEAAKVAHRLLEAVSRPFNLEKHEVTVTTSIGISIYPYDGSDVDTLLKHADLAMFNAKESGKSSYHFFSRSMGEISSSKLAMENQLRKALEQNEFLLYYQPKINVQNRSLVGVEALLRWNHPSRGIVPASEFISLAEETGLIRPIGEWVLSAACAQIVQWQKSGIEVIPVAVNLSSLQFRQENLIQRIAEILRCTSLDPRYLELEITESTIMENERDMDRSLIKLRDLGVRVSIDDFGTGYSSLSRLKSFTLDTLKIDRSFVADLPQNSNDRAITRAIITMAHSLDMKVIAEGVETQQQYDFLKRQGCDQIQGYLIRKPVPAAEFLEIAKRQSSGLVLPDWQAEPLAEGVILAPAVGMNFRLPRRDKRRRNSRSIYIG